MVYRQAEALKILYEKYLEFRGRNFETICQEHKINVQHWLPDPHDGRVLKIGDEFIIVLPATPSSPTMEQLIGFHELAHFFIFNSHWINFHNAEKKMAEAWCDNFSLAMILELHHLTPTGIENYGTFFRQGEGLERPEESDPFLSKKILSYFIDEKQLNFPFLNEPVVNLAPGCHPLIVLERELLISDIDD